MDKKMSNLKSKILVIEEDTDFLNIAANKLTQRGFDVFLSSNGKEAIDILKKENIEAILLDFNNANKNGIIVINYIYSLSKRPILLPLINRPILDDTMEFDKDFSSTYN
jgi:DNA-binding response OmpR family regulator